MSAGTEPGRREVAHRVFATEYDESTFQYSQSDEERAPNYVVTPTGARINRLFFVGVLTEVEHVNDDVVRARVVDPTGAFVIYAGQYQPDEMAFLERTDPPAFVAVTGKARTFEPDDGDRIYTSVRPESINEVDEGTRDRWVVQAAEHTLDRIATMATASMLDLGGEELADALGDRNVGESLAAGIPLALEQYGTGSAYLDALRRTALDAARVVAGERDEVRPPDVRPADTLGDAPAHDVLAETGTGAFVELSEPGDTGQAASEDEVETGTEPEPDTGGQGSVEAETEPTTDSEETSPAETEAETQSDEALESATEAGVESLDEPEFETEPEAEPPKDIDEDPEAAGGTEIETEAGSGPVEGEAEAEQTTEEELGDFDGGTLSDDTADEAAPATDDMYEFDEEERKEIEAEYGTEFETGTEVDEPGEADIESPSAEQEPTGVHDEANGEGSGTVDAGTDEATPEASPEPEASSPGDGAANGAVDDSETTENAGTDDEDESESALVDPDADVDEAVIQAMRELDDGDGADREAVIDAVETGTGADRAAIEDAIQEALMGGQCYEPDDGLLKPI